MMHLEVVVPTYNRADLLPVCLRSLLAGAIPDGLTVGITVVDNNSADDTREVVESWKDRFNGRLSYVFERMQGRSAALNAGITASESDWLGLSTMTRRLTNRGIGRFIKPSRRGTLISSVVHTFPSGSRIRRRGCRQITRASSESLMPGTRSFLTTSTTPVFSWAAMPSFDARR